MFTRIPWFHQKDWNRWQNLAYHRSTSGRRVWEGCHGDIPTACSKALEGFHQKTVILIFSLSHTHNNNSQGKKHAWKSKKSSETTCFLSVHWKTDSPFRLVSGWGNLTTHQKSNRCGQKPFFWPKAHIHAYSNSRKWHEKKRHQDLVTADWRNWSNRTKIFSYSDFSPEHEFYFLFSKANSVKQNVSVRLFFMSFDSLHVQCKRNGLHRSDFFASFLEFRFCLPFVQLLTTCADTGLYVFPDCDCLEAETRFFFLILIPMMTPPVTMTTAPVKPTLRPMISSVFEPS